jgi:hypothetical protein
VKPFTKAWGPSLEHLPFLTTLCEKLDGGYMATVTPAGTTVERSNLSNVVGVLALLAVIALIYFIARGREPRPITQRPAERAPIEQGQPVPPAPAQR